MAFKMRSGNTTSFKKMGSSPVKKPMKDFALNSQARKDEYDRRGWAHDDTTKVTAKAQPVKDTSKIETKAGIITNTDIPGGGTRATTTSKPSANTTSSSSSTETSTESKPTVKPADPASESETQKRFKGYQGAIDSGSKNRTQSMLEEGRYFLGPQDMHKKAADDGAKREAQRKQNKKRSKETTWGDDVGSTTSRDGSDYSATSTTTTKRRSGSTKAVDYGLSKGLHNQGKRTKKTVTDSKGKIKKVVTYDEKTGKRTGKVKYDKEGNVKLSRRDKRKKEEAENKAKMNKVMSDLERDVASSAMKNMKTGKYNHSFAKKKYKK